MSNLKNIIVIIGVIGIFALHPSLNKNGSPASYLQYLVYGNTLNVNYSNTIESSDLQIKWVCETQTASCKDLVIYQNGKQINEIPFEKGNQKLIIFYKENKIGEITQNKKTSKQAHEYKVDLISRNNQLLFNGEIIGPSPYKGPARTIASL